MAYSSPRHSQQFYQYDASTPPPPPPKPGRASGTATPSQGPPLPPPPGQASSSGDPQQHSQTQYQQPGHQVSDQVAVPGPEDGWLPDVLKDKSYVSSCMTKDLHHVLQTPELQHAIIHNPETRHGSLPASTAPLQTLLAQNIGLAESLKQLEAHVRHQRDDVQSRLLAMRALERQWRAKQSEQDEALREFSPPALYQRLSAAVGEQEALCRGLEESFLDGEGFGGGEAVASEREVTDFVRRLREGRKIAYLRAERKERWDEGRAARTAHDRPGPHAQAPPSSQFARASSADTRPLPASPPRQKASSLASIAISSFAAFRSQAPQPAAPPPPFGLQSPPVRRKPLPVDSPIAGRFPVDQFNRPIATTAAPSLNSSLAPPVTDEDLFVPRNLDDNPHGRTPLTETTPQPASTSPKSFPVTPTLPDPRHDRPASSIHPHQQSRSDALKAFGISGIHTRSPTMPNMPLYNTANNVQRPQPKLDIDGATDDFMDTYSYSPEGDSRSKQNNKPKSPGGGGFTSFFGWNSRAQNGPESAGTGYSERSPNLDSPRFSRSNKAKPIGLDIPAANSMGSYFNIPGTPLLSSSPQMNAHVEELERELREVSSELAASIQREMELEDEVERWKAESSTGISDNRRTSDYYSDSGTSSVRFPITDPESKLEELDTQRRKAEQERASLKVRMAERLQEELRRRRDLEEQVQQLEDQVSNKSRVGSVVEAPQVKELALSLEDAKRRLAEERQVKENFEDLLTALREELEKHRNEADNLRDEVVPQLRARLEVLEADAADTEKLVYESTRMQQEIKQLRSENESLAKARKQQLLQQQGQPVQFQSIAEEADITPLSNMRVGLTRSNSLARSSAGLNSKRGSLSRSNSVKDRSGDMSPVGAPAVSNPMKELEEQRDALHKALKHLLQRQEMQQREFQRRIREVEAERDAALNLTPRRTAFHKEVTGLRREVDSLRRRADEALEQKWQCEKGLGGLRMDLDRAQQETSSLRDLLREHDITIPEIRIENEPMALDKAYNELRTTHALSLARVKQLETSDADSLGAASAETERTLDLLKQSISDAEAERDYAQREAEQYRQQARALQQSEIEHLGKEQQLSRELFAAATRMDELSNKIQNQLTANNALRGRLTEAIIRGEQEQQKSTDQIVQLEKRLKAAEDKVMLAQQSSEEAIARHEGEVQALKEGHTNHLRRVKSGLLSPSAFSPKLPPSPVFAQKSPRLTVTTSGPAMTFAEATKTEMLEKRVEELEKALRDADHEMEEVVGRMNLAQMEVADLQFERDEAMRQTRGLQAEILAEREKVKALMVTTA
ncbi:intracellular protein transport-like protein [Bipolaris maydis]|uniref:intracellular protein transport-like protein n=1 Tax=Cochliobolus heterostrophus TaxID=5016 RepID=UPI0024D87BDA|nr:intracellular protein transport-like protein [Bipolaris maydis]KAJ6276593.1 intracellular protein transport-like protein [Bipolaris maydis]